MTQKPRALTRQMERLIETTLRPGRFVSYNANRRCRRNALQATTMTRLRPTLHR
jgi:hypothetical protein